MASKEASRDVLLELSESDFAVTMAEGEGDYRWEDVPSSTKESMYVESLDVAFPQWDPKFLARVQGSIEAHWERIWNASIVDGALDPAIQAEMDDNEYRSTITALDELAPPPVGDVEG